MKEARKPAASPTVIDLFGKPYQFKCEENEVAGLQKAATYLNNSIESLPASVKQLPTDKLAMMAALNLATQILELEDQMSQHMHFLNQRLDNLQSKLEFALPESYAEELEAAKA